MSLPEGYRPREGDVLVLHGTARFDVDPGDDEVHVQIDGDFASRIIPLNKVVGIHCRHWQIGDRVRLNDDAEARTVLAVHDDLVWTKADNGMVSTDAANELEEIPPTDDDR